MTEVNRLLAGPAGRHVAVVPSDTADLEPRPRGFRVLTAGNLVLMDEAGTSITYAVDAKEVIPFAAKRVLATGTTATVVAWV